MKKRTLKKVITYLKKYRIKVYLSLLLNIIIVLSTIFIPYFIGLAIDNAVSADKINYTEIHKYLLIIIILISITVITQFITNLINNSVSFNVTKDIRNQVFEKVHKLPLSYVDSHSTGSVVNIITTDCEQFGDGLLMFLTQFFSSVLTILTVIIFMIAINIWVALFIIFFTPISLFVAKIISKKSYNSFEAQAIERGKQMAILDEYIGEQKVIQNYSYEKQSQIIFDKSNDKLSKTSLKAIFVSSLVNPSTRFINALIYAGVALIGALIAISNNNSLLTVGKLTCLLGYANQYMKPFNELSGVVTELQNALACIGRVFSLLEEKDETNGTKELKKEICNFDINNVYFSYQKDKPLLTNINLKVNKGDKIAIVGPTGCGKTTLINLLMQFYKVNQGSILINNQSIYEITKESYRNNIGMVLQDTWIFNGTIKDNLTMGNKNILEQELIEVCKKVKIYHFIKQQQNGFDTIIKDDSLLSIGQKQLICIARVMLLKPQVLILDEATSNIDTRTEIIVQQAFDELMKGKTSFVVAHRLSTIKKANQILVMKNGNIVEQGNHSELLKRNGLYSQIYNSQFIITK